MMSFQLRIAHFTPRTTTLLQSRLFSQMVLSRPHLRSRNFVRLCTISISTISETRRTYCLIANSRRIYIDIDLRLYQNIVSKSHQPHNRFSRLTIHRIDTWYLRHVLYSRKLCSISLDLKMRTLGIPLRFIRTVIDTLANVSPV
jgi:hypothetical protein